MSNTETEPVEHECAPAGCAESMEILTPREVPLGGPRAMTVRRTLPQRRRSLIGPWCFVDHFGPDDVAETGGMAVPRHPHTGLATVTLLFEGEVDHRDTSGFANTVRPGEVNLMIAGTGIAHSEFSSTGTTHLRGVQLWYALPDARRRSEPGSQHHVPELVELPGGTVRTYLDALGGVTSPVETRVGALAAEVTVTAGTGLDVELDPTYEHGLLVDTGEVTIVADGHRRSVAPHELAFLPVGPGTIRLEAGDEPVRAILVGGEPFGEQIVMWWNFVGRTHEEIVGFREAWQAEIGAEPSAAADEARASGRYADGTTYPQFGTFPAGQPDPLPAPALPHARITPREQ